MASDDEFRRVAEEIRALARSLARDFRDAVDQSRAGGSRAGEAVRHGLKDVADEARRGVHGTIAGFQPRPRSHRSRHRGWYPPAPPGGDARYGGPPHRPRQRSRHRSSGRRRRGLPPVRHRWDATTVIGTLAVVFGVAWLLDAVHAAHISAEGAVAAGLMVLGAAMIVTGRTDWSLSRRSWPVFAGAALILVLVATSNTFGVGSGTSGLSFGNKVVPVFQSGQTVQNGFGNLTVDASRLTAGQKVTVENIVGNIHVTLPHGLPARIDARILAGVICIDGRDVGNGAGASAHEVLPGAPGVAPVIVDVHEASGRILVGPGGCSK
ncbi:MAG TPA: hypothetical protein VNF71_13315 [Acidimicrobiales bacterium]|nr:hypothetical protein [Acidimicrobiales bacterium]